MDQTLKTLIRAHKAALKAYQWSRNGGTPPDDEVTAALLELELLEADLQSAVPPTAEPAEPPTQNPAAE